MADAFEDIRTSLEKQIGDLKTEMARISKSLASHASDAVQEAEDAYETGKGRARAVASRVRDQAHVAADVARENPVTTSTVLVGVGLLGIAMGYLLSGSADGNRRR
ncbi:hypothetical protein [Paracoccus sp. IB05]|uniref:hypothetical protein n=1 Tax=Paracoccus sp. IB05 TaxID=2779367 RepID=UPI0018E7E8E6|nr:hypothetical protein [Paracoccus sp. IB05]MBJ2149777.1 hypothetical protein [Paracoccus sp. IB05]